MDAIQKTLPKVNTHKIKSVTALWDALVKRAGLNIKDRLYDAALVDELAKALTIPPKNFRRELLNHGISNEQLLRGFLKCQGPFAVMMSDLLAFFARSGAKATANNLRIEFNFSERGKPLEFDIENFREWERRWRRATIGLTFDRLHWSEAGHIQHSLMREGVTYRLVNGGDLEYPNPSDRKVARWIRAEVSDAELFLTLPPPPKVDNDEVAAYLERIWALLYACGDASVWERGAPLTALDVVHVVRDAYLQRETLSDLLPTWREIFRETEKRTIEVEADIEELFEFFNLPIWKLRSEVYSVWVGTCLINAFGDLARVHIIDRKLVFSFGGTHLATVRLPDGQNLAIWCEVRTPAKKLLGKKRKSNIQPDFVVLREPTSHPGSTALVVECKQYKKQNTREFAAALIDYARTHRNAKVILVNYAAITNAVIDFVAAHDAAVVPRTLPIGEFRPASLGAHQCFQEAIDALIPHPPSPPLVTASAPAPSPHAVSVSSVSAPIMTGSLNLSWEGNIDLDVYCWLVRASGVEQVYFKRQEWSQADQRIWLIEDVRKGGVSESLHWERIENARLEFAINAFGESASIASAGKTAVTLTLENVGFTLNPPAGEPGIWWHLLALGPTLGAIEIWNKVDNSPPQSAGE